MERMRREQEMAFQDTFEDVDMEDFARRRRETQEEEDMLKKAIEESEKLAREVEERQRQENQDRQPHTRGSSSASPAQISSSLREGQRVYDDEDEELQAALRASLQDVPPGYNPPRSPPKLRRHLPMDLSASRKHTLAPVMGTAELPTVFTPGVDSGLGGSQPTGLSTSMFPKDAAVMGDAKGEEKERNKEKGKGKDTRKAGDETDSEAETEMEGSITEPNEDEITMEEMRKRRLARFGA